MTLYPDYDNAAVQSMVEKAMSVLPADPTGTQTAMAMAMLLPLRQTAMEPVEVAVRAAAARSCCCCNSESELQVEAWSRLASAARCPNQRTRSAPIPVIGPDCVTLLTPHIAC